MNEAAAVPVPPPEPERVGRPVIVLGMDRSGTSLAASLIHRWGAFGGDEESLRWGNRGNPRGYFEHRPMQAFLVHRLGTEFWADGYTESLREKARDPAVRAEALELMEEMRRGSETWFWKDPLLSVMLPFWESLWSDRAAYVILLRDPWKCAVSWNEFLLPTELQGRIDIRGAALLRWQIFMLSILEATEGRRNCLFVRYEDLVESPVETVAHLVKHLDAWAGGRSTSEECLESMAAMIDPSLARTESGVGFSIRTEASRSQKYLWESLQRKVADPAAQLELEPAAPWPGWREYMSNLREFWFLYERSIPLLRSRWATTALQTERLLKTPWRRLSGLYRAARGGG